MLNKLVLGSGYWYLATPYSKYALGIEMAADHAGMVAAELMRRHIPVFSPIAHTHHIALSAGIDPKAHDFWMGVDGPMMTASGGLIMVLMRGWRESRGMGEELENFRAMRKPIAWLDPKVLGLEIPHDISGVLDVHADVGEVPVT